MTGDVLLDAMRWWTHWNLLAQQHATLTYRLEDLDPELFGRLVTMVGLSPTASPQEAFDAVPRAVNSGESRGHATTAIDLG